jgi:ubiquitin-conjugating enzyme E2 D/E
MNRTAAILAPKKENKKEENDQKYIRRLMKESDDMVKTPPENCSAAPFEKDGKINYYHWTGCIIGSKGTPYEDGVFKVDINIPNKYPHEPPKVIFRTKIFHPNISMHGGDVCISILKHEWSPALSISRILISISSLMSAPNPDDPLEPEIAEIYKNNVARYNLEAQQYTRQYAR